MTDRKNPFPQMANEYPLLPKPLVSQEEFLNPNEEQLETVVGGGGCMSCLGDIFRKTPENIIRTSDGKPARNVVEAYSGWEHAHPTPEEKRTATWYPKETQDKRSRTFWVKDPIPS